MPKPKPVFYEEASKYYRVLRSKDGAWLMLPQRNPPGKHCTLPTLAKEPAQVWLGAEVHTRLRVLYALIHKCDVDADTKITGSLEATTYARPHRLSPNGAKYKAKPHNFDGVPMAGVCWIEKKRLWAVTVNNQRLGYFKDYHDACNERMKAIGYHDVNPERGTNIYPAPKLAYFAMFKGRRVPRGYRSWITYDKHQEFYRVHLDGKTVQLFKTLSEAIQEVDKWKA